jgi:hypothetical protein
MSESVPRQAKREMKPPITAETEPELWKALCDRSLNYHGIRPAGFVEGWDAAMAAADERERALTEALRKIVLRGGGAPPYSQMALDMWMIARAALPVPVEGEADR